MTRDSHLAHDPYLIAQLAAGDLVGTERAAAERVVAGCERCRELHADLTTIMAATADLPAPTRTRDFRLTDADAARLRSPWRGWFGPLAKPRFAFVQPVGAALATLGLAGLLVGILPNLAVTSSAPAAAPASVGGTTAPVEAAPSDTKSAPSPAASAAFAQSAPTASPRDNAAGAAPTAAPTAEPIRITSATAAPSASNDSIAAPQPASLPPVAIAPVATAASGGAADSAPASDGTGSTSIQTGPANVGAAPSAAPTAAPVAAPSVAPTPARGVTTGINPGRSPNPTPAAEVPAAPAGTQGNGLLVASAAVFVVGLVLLVARRTALRAAR